MPESVARTTRCGSYFFEIQRTYAPIDPAHCLAKVPRSKQHVALKLRKHVAGVEWPHLRCIDNEVLGYSM